MTSATRMFGKPGFEHGYLTAPVRSLDGKILGYIWINPKTQEPFKVESLSHTPVAQPALFKSKLAALRAFDGRWGSLRRVGVTAMKYGDLWVLVQKSPVAGKFVALRNLQQTLGII